MSLERYRELCSIRDGVNKATQADQELLNKANARVQEAQADALEVFSRINQARLDADWITLNKEIASIARILGAKDGVLAHKGI